MNSKIDPYNEEVGRIYASDPDFFMFSPVFCRCEGPPQLFTFWASGYTKVPPAHFISLLLFGGKILRDLALSLTAERIELSDPLERDVFVFSYFDSRNSDNGTLREEYFQGILEGNQKVLCFYKLVSPGLYRRGVRYLKLIASLKKNFFACAEHSFISPGMVLEAVGLTLLHWVRFKTMRFADGRENPVSELLKSAHLREIKDGTVYSGYIQKLLFEKLLHHHPRVILFVWENSTWERILEHVKKQISPATISRGFQHTGFSKKNLQHYPSCFEGRLNTYPDYILCNGDVTREELQRNQAISSKIITGGALRQTSLLRKGMGKIPDLSSAQSLNLVFAFSWDQSTYDQILADLKRLPGGVTVHLKFHPMFPDWLDRNDLPARFINSRASWIELGSTCSLVLAHDNSLMFEGYYHGMHTAVYDGPDPLGLEKRDFESPLLHLTQADLPSILSVEIINRINTSTRQMRQTRYLERYFVHPEERDPFTC